MIGVIHICDCNASAGSASPWECDITKKNCPYTAAWVAACDRYEKDKVEKIEIVRVPYPVCENYPKEVGDV